MDVHWFSIIAVIVIALATVSVGVYATRVARTTSDFYVASRAVGPFLNASAISGEFLSAASFLGVAGMVMKFGYDALWYPVSYAAGYLILLLFVAAPLRRFGAYTIPDFAEGRFGSQNLRKVTVVFVLLIGLFYMLPQMKGAGITLRAAIGTPYWFGVVIIGGTITLSVALGGMKGITFVQAFQFWIKMFAVSVATFFLVLHFAPHEQLVEWSRPDSVPLFDQETTIEYKADAEMTLYKSSRITAEDRGSLRRSDGTQFYFEKEQEVTLEPGTYIFQIPTRVTYPEASIIPNAPDTQSWSTAFGPLTNGQGLPLLYTYSLIIAIVFGAAGLPHILVRFYTNRDGHAARQTTVTVLGLIGVFYFFPPIIGAVGRLYAPDLYASGATDAVILSLPSRVTPNVLGELLASITTAGAFAAFISTTLGLMISTSSALSHDIYCKILHPGASARTRLVAFKLSSVLIGILVIALGLQVERFDINMLVGWGFAIAASCFFPLLSLGTWWRRITSPGAISGASLGGFLATASIVFTMVIDPKFIPQIDPLVWTLLVQPAIWTMPASFATMVVVSLLTQKRLPGDVQLQMLRLHVPDSLGIRTDYIRD